MVTQTEIRRQHPHEPDQAQQTGYGIAYPEIRQRPKDPVMEPQERVSARTKGRPGQYVEEIEHLPRVLPDVAAEPVKHPDGTPATPLRTHHVTDDLEKRSEPEPAGFVLRSVHVRRAFEEAPLSTVVEAHHHAHQDVTAVKALLFKAARRCSQISGKRDPCPLCTDPLRQALVFEKGKAFIKAAQPGEIATCQQQPLIAVGRARAVEGGLFLGVAVGDVVPVIRADESQAEMAGDLIPPDPVNLPAQTID